jgi:transmembrane sensor
MEKTIIQKILLDYFEGRATTLQRKLIEDWLKEDGGNEVLFYQYLDEWESQTPQYLPDEEKGWDKFKTVLDTPISPKIELFEKEEVVEPLTVRSRRNVWLAAASIAFLIAASLFVFQKPILYYTYETGYAETQNLTLSDGTQVTLNAHSKLEVPRWGFKGEKREVFLEGEGEFNVTHTTDNKRFIIRTNTDFEVEVFGTQFVFYARENAKKLVLNEGKVQINYQAGKQQIMKPGDVVTLDARVDTLKLSKTDNPQKYSVWKNHQFYFDNTTLLEASVTIKEHFGLQLIFKDSILENRRLSGYFKAEKSEDLFNALSLLLNINIQKQNNTVLISSKQ